MWPRRHRAMLHDVDIIETVPCRTVNAIAVANGHQQHQRRYNLQIAPYDRSDSATITRANADS
uniref:SFRICE_023641 n=1 Tax=Spodoptera frugiperda TaxID=7108 RepID=A0A2H1WPN2_SPOFR